jgi:tRNA-modifying protein YgfZ
MPIPQPAQILIVEGADAVAFAQAQFSSNLAALSNGQWQFSAWLDAQGRVRTFFHLAKQADDRLLLLLRGGDATNMAHELRRFIFRSRVTLSTKVSTALSTGAAMPMHTFDVEEGRIRLGCGDHSLQSEEEMIGDDAWRSLHLFNGWPWLPEQTLSELLPPALSLHHLGAVALDKGCYPGQEIVARLHYRHGHKRHLHRVALSEAVSPGTTLRRNDREFVRLLDVLSQADKTEALAVIADEIANIVAQSTENTSDDGIRIDIRQTWPD